MTENEIELQETEEVEEVEEQPVQEEVDIEKELNDKYMRLLAEFDNFKKRTQKEKIQIYTDAAADVVEAVLPVFDNLQRAISSEVEGDAKTVLEGVKLIEKQFEDSLKNIGVTQINAVGEQFDPEMHNAVMHIDDEGLDNNIVVEEFAKGYKYKEKVIRHSMVKVAN